MSNFVRTVNLRKAIQEAQNVSGPDVLRPAAMDLASARVEYGAQLHEFFEQFSARGGTSRRVCGTGETTGFARSRASVSRSSIENPRSPI